MAWQKSCNAGLPLKQGDKRADGKIFWGYQRQGEYESWMTLAAYARAVANMKAYRIKNPERSLLCGARARAKRLGLAFEITVQDIPVPACCPILGIPLVRCKGNSGPSSPTVDRIYPDLGYVPGNVVVISLAANILKGNSTPVQLQLLAKFYKKFIS